MWQELCKMRAEYLDKYNIKAQGYPSRLVETLLYEIARLEGITVKKQDFLDVLNEKNTPERITEWDIYRIKDLESAFLYLVRCSKQQKKFSSEFVRDVSALVMKHTGKEETTTVGRYDTSLGDFRLGEELLRGRVLSDYTQIPDMLDKLCKKVNEELDQVHDIMTVKLGARFHYRFLHIKPFGEGNIEVALLLMNYIQMLFNEPLIVIPGEDKAKYLSALKMQKDKPTPEIFEEFVGKELLESLQKELS